MVFPTPFRPIFKFRTSMESDEEEEHVALVAPEPSERKKTRNQRRKAELFFAILGGAVLIINILFFAKRLIFGAPTYTTGWKTAFGAPFPALSVERVQFDAGLALDANGEVVRTPGRMGAPQYVGHPSDEIDKNWDLLIPSDTNITRAEAEQIGGEFYFYPDTDIATIEVSSFHILHCLDQVRRLVYWQIYEPDGMTELLRVHADHCIDTIRQYVQCHMDLTPINLVWSEQKGGILPEFRQMHTCRSYREAHEWILRRNIANYENGIGDEGVAEDAMRTLKQMGWE